MSTQAERAEAFRALHEGEPFVIPNPWDAGSARVLAGLGFQALATTSSAFAFTLGRSDGEVTLDELSALGLGAHRSGSSHSVSISGARCRESCRSGSSPVLTKRWGTPAGTTTTSPGPTSRVSSPAV